MKKILAVLLALICSITVSGCNTAEKNDRLQVYTSFYAMYDFAHQICGDKADIYILCPTSQEPHDYEPTPKDIANLSSADVFVYNGMGMEHWADSIVDTLKESEVLCVNTTDNVPNKTNNLDPHVWLNPHNAYKQLTDIYEAVISVDPQNADYYKENLDNCKAKIDTIINDYTVACDSFKSKDIVVSHEAYGNLCDAFSLNQIPINGLDNSHDPSPSQMAKVEAYIKDNSITHIFKEPLGTSSIVEAIANDTDTQILVLDPFEGNLENKDYFTVMYENLEALKTALS